MPEEETKTTASGSPATNRTSQPQFSLAWLLIAVTVVSVMLGLGVTIGQYGGALLLTAIVGCILPTPLVVVALFAHGDIRIFAIGALVPWVLSRGLLIYPSVSAGPTLLGYIGWTLFMLVTAGVCGGVAVATHRRIEPWRE